MEQGYENAAFTTVYSKLLLYLFYNQYLVEHILHSARPTQQSLDNECIENNPWNKYICVTNTDSQ